ncbi:MAG: VWA domain-containing protein [Thermodesulfovibrionales bacterium]
MSRDKMTRNNTACSRIFRAQWIGFFIVALFVFGFAGKSDAATITVVKSGTGTGNVVSAPAGIDCGPTCSYTNPPGAGEIILTATADPGSEFVSWTGCTTVDTNKLCHWAGGLDTTVTANFSSLNDRVVKINAIDRQCSTVSACVKVKGTAGLLTNLAEKDFTLREDALPQTDFTVQRATCPGSSVAIGVTMDYSGSMSPQALTDMENAAISFVNKMTATASEMEIVKFSDTVEVVQDFTPSATALTNAILADWPGTGGATALYDAVFQAMLDTSAKNASTAAVIAMTDGGDNSSAPDHTVDTVIQFANNNGLQIFSIGLGTGIDAAVLTRMALETGGKYYEAPSSSDLAAIFDAISNDLAEGYVLTYPELDLRANQAHTLEIQVSPNKGGTASVQYSTIGCRVLTVNATGSAGSILSDIGGINFSSPAANLQSTILAPNSYINLYANLASANSVFGWTGECAGGINPCEIKMDADNKNVTVNFSATGSPTQFILGVTKSGTGSGTVFPVITENDDAANQLDNWQLDGITTANTNAYTLYWNLSDFAGVRTVQLYKALAKGAADRVAQGSLSGNGIIFLTAQNSSGITGSVDVAYTGNDTDPGNTLVSLNMGALVWNGNTGTATHNNTDIVTLQAVANTGSVFNGWSGAGCSGTGVCRVTMSAARSVTADFVADGANGYSATLTVTKNGNGFGNVRVTSVTIPSAINNAEITENGDSSNQLTNWQLLGVSTENTDAYTLYWELTDDGGTRKVSLYKTAAKAAVDLVAQGSLLGDGTINLSAQHGSGLSGSVDVVYRAVITEIGDSSAQLSGWQLSGISIDNVDFVNETTFQLTWALDGTAGAGTISLSNAGGVVAEGLFAGAGPVVLNPQGGSGLSGTVNVTPLLTLVEAGDTANQVANWQLAGITTGNSDNYTLYWELIDFGGTRTVSLYKDTAKLVTDLMAQGSLGGNGHVLLTERTGSGIFGSVDITYHNINDTSLTNTITLTLTADNDADNKLVLTFGETDTGNTLVLPDIGVLVWNGNTGTATHKANDIVVLTALPSPGSSFTGWNGGGCIGTGTCTVTMDVAKGVTATFTRPDPPSLTVNMAGSGSGSVTPDTGSLFFIGSTAVTTYPYSTIVTLTAVPSAGSVFTGWSGECRNTGPVCTILMSGNMDTTAHFLVQNTSSYADVPSGSFVAPFTETLSNNSVTAGCFSGNFCPSTVINNGQMAIFIVKALGLPPADTCTGTMFNDVNSSLAGGAEACRFMEKFGELNILSARSDGNFLPNATVSRALIAEVILRALGASPAASCSSAVFDDVNDGMFGGGTSCRYIEKFYEFSASAGCGDNNYCPDSPLTRDQLAVLLTETILQINSACRTNPVRNHRTFIVYDSIQAAYGDLSNPPVNGDIFQITGTTSLQPYSNIADFNLPVSITLRGGYDCGFVSSLSRSSIQGVLTVTDGDVTIDNIEIQ